MRSGEISELISSGDKLNVYLMKNPVRLPVPGSLGLVRLDGPDVVRDTGPELFHQLVGLVLDLRPGCRGSVPASSVNLVRLKQLLEELVLGRLHQLDQVDGEDIFVSLHKAVHVVGDHASVVVDHKPGTHIIISSTLKGSRE